MECTGVMSGENNISTTSGTTGASTTTFIRNNNNNNNNNNKQFDETIDHIIAACAIMAKEQCIKRRDRVCAQLLFNIRKETGVQLDKNTGKNLCQNQ